MKCLLLLVAITVAACSAKPAEVDLSSLAYGGVSSSPYSVSVPLSGENQQKTHSLERPAELIQLIGDGKHTLILQLPPNYPQETVVLNRGRGNLTIKGRRISVSDLEDAWKLQELKVLALQPGAELLIVDAYVAPVLVPQPITSTTSTTTTTTPRSTTTPPSSVTFPPVDPYVPSTPGTGSLCSGWRPVRGGKTYAFGYSVNHADTGDIKCHKESRDGDWAEGVYALVEPDGNARTVTYTSDKDVGFLAYVSRTPDVVVPAPEPLHPWKVIVRSPYKFGPTVQREDGYW